MCKAAETDFDCGAPYGDISPAMARDALRKMITYILEGK